MSRKDIYLGEFEHIVLLAILRLGADAYGMRMRTTINDLIHRDVSIGALYATLERLEKKKFVKSRLGEATAERGGRAKRYFELTSLGKSALTRTRSNLETMWRDISW